MGGRLPMKGLEATMNNNEHSDAVNEKLVELARMLGPVEDDEERCGCGSHDLVMVRDQAVVCRECGSVVL
jgi:hypothetical protein